MFVLLKKILSCNF